MANITKYKKERESIQLMSEIAQTTNLTDDQNLPNTRERKSKYNWRPKFAKYDKEQIQLMAKINQILERERMNPTEREEEKSNRWPKSANYEWERTNPTDGQKY